MKNMPSRAVFIVPFTLSFTHLDLTVRSPLLWRGQLRAVAVEKGELKKPNRLVFHNLGSLVISFPLVISS